MMGDDDTTIGKGGWILVVLSGVVTFAILRGWMFYHFVPAGLFSAAIALIVMLVLYRLAVAVNRYEDEEEARKVRKLVPASVDAGVGAAAKAVPVRAEALVAPQRPSAVVTPLASVEAPPVILPPTGTAPAVAPAVVAEPAAVVESAGPEVAAPKPKAKAGAKPKGEAKAKAVKAKAAPKTGTKTKAEPGEKPAKAAKPKVATARSQGLVRLEAPRGGQADSLQEIEGIGPALEKLVNSLGFYHFDRIAGWSEADIATVDAEMKTFKGRIARDKWVEQARIIVNDGLEAFRERAKTNSY